MQQFEPIEKALAFCQHSPLNLRLLAPFPWIFAKMNSNEPESTQTRKVTIEQTSCDKT